MTYKQVYTEEDFCFETHHECWGVSEESLQRIKEAMIGQAVPPEEFSAEELIAAGYSSWKHYDICAAIRAW